MRFEASERVEAEAGADTIEERGEACACGKAPIPTFLR